MGEKSSGKSFLLNNLLGLEENNCFMANYNDEPSVYIWSVPMKIDEENKNIFFLDVDGFNKNSLDLNYKLFNILSLLSSTIIFNTFGSFNDSSLKKLYLLSTFSAGININENNIDNISQEMPKIIWTIRDYEKDSKDFKVGDKIIKFSANELMEIIINDYTKCKNELTYKVRKSFNEIFKQRDCVSLPRPFKINSGLSKNKKNEELNNNFLHYCNELMIKINKKTQIKTLKNTNLNGRMILSLLGYYLEMINGNKLIDLDLAWEYLAENEIINSFNEAVHLYHDYLRSNFHQDQVIPENEIHSIIKHIRDLSMEKFYSCSFIKDKNEKIVNEYKKKLIDFVNEKENMILKLNSELLSA